MSATTSEVVAPASGVRKQLRKSPFFAALGLLMLVLAIGGFWPQYFSAVTGNAPSATTRHWLIHLHAALFTVWLLLYIVQAGLIVSVRARLHLKWGPSMAAYGFAIALVGLYAAALLADRLGRRVDNFEQAAAFVFFPIIDMIYFAGFLAVALVYRRRPEVHKRAMFLATFSIAVVGIGRLVFRTGIESPLIWEPLNLAPLLIALVYDLVVCRRAHAVMVAGLAVHLFRLNADALTMSEAWLPIGRALIAPFR